MNDDDQGVPVKDWMPEISEQTLAASRPDQMEIDRLAALPPLDRDRELKPTAKAMGVTVGTLRAEVARVSESKTDADDGDVIESLELWPDAVDGDSLAEEIRDVLNAYVIFAAPSDADAATLWVLGSYLMDTWRLWPRLLITSPVKACGKSTLLEAIEAVAHRGLILSNAKSAGIFRAISAWQPTLILDEADTWAKHDEELAGILNSGHTRRTARVIRIEDRRGTLEPTLFSTWAPMVIAGIGGQRDTLESRSIRIALRRKLPSEAVARMPIDLHARHLRVRRQATRWAADNAETLTAMDAEPPACGDDRRRDNFTPLWRIASVLGGVWPDRMAAAYLAASDTDDDDNEPAGIMLLRDLQDMFDVEREDRLGRTFVVNRLITLEDRPWSDWRHGKPITAHALTRLLKPFGIAARSVRFRGENVQGYPRDTISEAFKRYVPGIPPEKSATLLPSNYNNDLSVANSETGDGAGTNFATPKPLKANDCSRVAENTAHHQALPEETSVGGRPLKATGRVVGDGEVGEGWSR